jgi:hypothetical protein
VIVNLNEEDGKVNQSSNSGLKFPGRLVKIKQSILQTKDKVKDFIQHQSFKAEDVNESNINVNPLPAFEAKTTSTSPKNADGDKFIKFLEEPEVDILKIRKMCWSGIPAQHRATYWLLLIVLDYFLYSILNFEWIGNYSFQQI